jgi:hypothetical protein
MNCGRICAILKPVFPRCSSKLNLTSYLFISYIKM